MKAVFLALMIWLAGACAWSYTYHPPHGGHLVDLGGARGYLELVFSSEDGLLSGYVLDENAETRVLVKQARIVLHITPKNGAPSFDIALKAVNDPSTGETPGNTSQFRGQDNQLKGLDGFFGTVVSLNSKGRDFRDVSFDIDITQAPQ